MGVLHISTFDRALLPAFATAVLTVGAFGPAIAEAKPDSPRDNPRFSESDGRRAAARRVTVCYEVDARLERGYALRDSAVLPTESEKIHG